MPHAAVRPVQGCLFDGSCLRRALHSGAASNALIDPPLDAFFGLSNGEISNHQYLSLIPTAQYIVGLRPHHHDVDHCLLLGFELNVSCRISNGGRVQVEGPRSERCINLRVCHPSLCIRINPYTAPSYTHRKTPQTRLGRKLPCKPMLLQSAKP